MAFLLDDIFLSPIKGVGWLAEKLKDLAVSEMTDESRVQEALIELQMRLELEEITEDEYDRREADLMKKLEEIRKLKEGL